MRWNAGMLTAACMLLGAVMASGMCDAASIMPLVPSEVGAGGRALGMRFASTTL